ncbi:Alpha/beta hydrolase family protein [Cryptosporidium meleagridis]|uniref:Alpha/beta hydrolase family protein n=1 Tax=Cryptosporidium meleagridis TaxID=93969 RepID=A0A2P4Z0J3_9CRYT|nr:Alpha/beta hydrolase family protein [Cryptosporidium meleagridis]
MSSEKKGMLFCLGCISVIPGLKNQLVNSMSFHPPTIKGYKYSKCDNSIVLFDFHRKRYVTLNEMKKNLINIDPGRCQIQVKFSSFSSVDFFYYKNPAAKFTIIYSHSNATDIGYLFGHLLDFSHKACVNIISYEYNGYGQSKKKTSEDSLYENIKTIVHYSINHLKLPPSSLILYGQSIGSAPTVHFASTYNSVNIAGIIIHSGIKSAVSVICNNTNSKSLPWYDAFKNLEKIQKVKCPVFVIHGTADTVIPFNHGEMLYKLSPNKYTPWYVNGANHCNIELNWRDELISKVRQFILYLSPKPKIQSYKPSYMTHDHTLSISRISTLSSQGFENLYHELDDDNDDDNIYDNCQEYQSTSQDLTNNDQAICYYREKSYSSPENYTNNLLNYQNIAKSSNKYFNHQSSTMKTEKNNTPSNFSTSSKSKVTCSNTYHPNTSINSHNSYSRALNSTNQTPSGNNRPISDQVVYGVSIYDDNINLHANVYSGNCRKPTNFNRIFGL